MAVKRGKNAERKNNTARNILIVAVIAVVLFIFKDKVASSVGVLDGLAQAVNFKLVKVKSIVYKQTLKFKSRIHDMNYIDT